MSLHSFFLPAFFLICTITGCIVSTRPVQAEEAAVDQYALSLSFDLEKNLVIGTARITIKSGQQLTLDCRGIKITGSLLQEETGREHQLVLDRDIITLPPKEGKQTLYLSYSKNVTNSRTNRINSQGIALTEHWYPFPQTPATFEVTATLPENFEAITESNVFPLKQEGRTVKTTFSHPTTTIHFIAGPYSIQKKQVRKNLFVYSMFFPEDDYLAADYLQSAAQYLNRYEKEIGPYPYNHYVIVANRLPTGFGMPTFTLMGQMVLRLPFIRSSSLGHEIVHSWFGNAVHVDYSQGNWCEGLTSYLADYAYREDAGEGAASRKESISKYLSYVHPHSAIPLSSFTSASHSQYNSEVKRVVGYNRGALLFHELREQIGHQAFEEGLRLFYQNNRGREATWDDLRKSFESSAQSNLGNFFVERLTRTSIPELAVKNIAISYEANKPVLSFTMTQLSSMPFSLDVPIQVETMGGRQTFTRKISDVETNISIPLSTRPLAFVIDPDYAFLRALATEEYPAVWSRFLGAEKKLVVFANENDREKYRPLLTSLAIEDHQICIADKVSNTELSQNSILFLDSNQPAARTLFGRIDPPSSGIIFDIRRNPLNRDHVAVLVSMADPQELNGVSRRLSHYGKYSYLSFTKGKSTVKTIQPTESGLKYILEDLPMGGATSTQTTFDSIVKQLSQYRVVYVGETHTSLPDHILQLRIIEALYANNKELAIGMEMFPASSQDALNKYLLGTGATDERTFLVESDYYNVWRYDYRYFRDILNFAKNNKIPVIGLNLDRKIVSEVFRTGSTDSLDESIRQSLPEDRNLDLPGYAERLSQIHNMHIKGSHATGMKSGFIQAQGLWDETMAQNIASFLESHPHHKMVVLAGNQHTRKDSGIPPRVTSRIAVKQASVLNIYNESAPENLDTVADYYFLATPDSLPETPKIGVVLISTIIKETTRLKISEISPHGKAATAGLLVGDILQEVHGFNITTMAELKIAMIDTRPGDSIEVQVLRQNRNQDEVLPFVVELSQPQTNAIHP